MRSASAVRRRLLLAAVLVPLLVLLTACGSTVPLTGGVVTGSGTTSPTGGALDGTSDGVTTGSGSTSGTGGSSTTGGGGPSRRAVPAGSVATGSPTTGGSTSPSTGGGTSTGTSTGTSSGGGPAIRTPISVGILTANNDAAGSVGVDNGNSFTPRKAFEALVAAFNARGGLAGRRIVPVYAELQSSSSSYGTDLAAACSTFTEDNHVAVVLSVVGLYLESFDACLAKAGVPLVTGDYALGDDQALRADTGLLTATTISTDTRMRVLLERLTAAKGFTATDKLGVIVEGCPYNQRTYDGTVVPVAQRLGHPVADHVTVRCFGGISDLSGQASDMSSAVLRFRQSNITQVTFVSGGSEGNLLLLFATAAESQDYHPHYALTSVAIPTVQEANTPPAQLANARGLGWLPSVDTTQGADVLRPAQRSCLADLKSGGLVPASPADRTFAYTTCDAIGLYAAVLSRTFGASDRSSVLAGAQALGTSYSSPATYGGLTDFRSGRRTGPAEGRLFGWSTGCSCFTYTGSPFPLF